MKAYIGSKIILAEPMTDIEWKNRRMINDSENQDGPKPGYHVKYSDGYESWSPKATFEEAYRPVSDREKEMVK